MNLDLGLNIGTSTSSEAPGPILYPPVAIFTEDSNNDTREVNFNATSSSDSDGTILSYKWDFGDETVGTGATISHTYSADGTYDVTLTTTDNDGLTSTMTKEVSTYIDISAADWGMEEDWIDDANW